jgi:acid stress-induced BolA-like protein IbaG/YrbA
MTLNNEDVELKLESVKFYLNLIGYSRIAKTRIIKNKIETNIIFPKNAIHTEILNLNELFTKWLTPEINTIDKLIDANDLYKIRIDNGEIYFDSFFRKINEFYKKDETGFLEKSLIYPFFKYPDDVSIVQNFCFILDLGGYIIDLDELKKDHSVRIEKVDDIIHDNFIYTYLNRHKILVDESLKSKIIEITKGTESDIKWLKKLNKIEGKPYQGKINLGYLLNEKKNIPKNSTEVNGLHLINRCNYGTKNIECTNKCTNSFYKKIKYKNIDDLVTGSTKLNIGHLSSIYKKSKNSYKFVINSYIRNQLIESALFSPEEFKFAPSNGIAYKNIIKKKDIISNIQFITIISHLRNKYEVNDHNNIYQKLIDQIKTNLV